MALHQPRWGLWHLARYVVGQILLLACLSAAVMLVVQHLGGLKLPGCGVMSACAQLAAGRWGNVAGWPVSFLGAAWFAAFWVFYSWTARRDGLPPLVAWGARLGAAVSLFFLGVMIAQRHFCPYCVTVHGGNLAFGLLVELTPRSSARSAFRPAVAAAAVFVAVSCFLGLYQSAVGQSAASRAEREFQNSLDEIVARILQQNVEGAGAQKQLPAPGRGRGAGDEGTSRPVSAASVATAAHPGAGIGGVLRRRWRRGPEVATIRLVLFADYECPHCRKLEAEIESAMAGRNDVSLVVKHYPLCGECNRQIRSEGPHRNACRAALAVEAAGECDGNRGWWRMHDWLRTHDIRFSDAQLAAAALDLGLGSADVFLAAMHGRPALERVRGDVETASRLGIDATPVLFINGMELAHPEIAQGIPRAMAALGSANPRPRTAVGDQPRPGQERLTALWLSGREFDLSGHVGRWTLGPADAPHHIVLSICHQNEYSARFSAAVRQLVAQRSDVRVEFWHFPLTKRANPAYARSRDKDYANSYEMALVAEACGRLGGNDVFWKMHQWLLDHANEFTLKAVQEEAARLGLDRLDLLAEIHRRRNRSAVDQDIAASMAAGIQGSPSIFLGGRLVPGPEPTAALMERILDQMHRMWIH
jgi:protein-disulfide isomerase/uncharacterized membrane protein